MIPFKGIYLELIGNRNNLCTNVYPVPSQENPFLGIHFTITSDGRIKIGPTAMPALWRENYNGIKNFKFYEFCEIIYFGVKLFILNNFNFRKLAIQEIKNYNKNKFISKAKSLIDNIEGEFKPIKPGIRAQLLNKKTNELVEDFIIEHTKNSTHILKQ